MTHIEQKPQDTPRLELVHSLPAGVFPPEPSSIGCAPLYSVDNPDRTSRESYYPDALAAPLRVEPQQPEGKVIDARGAFEARGKAVLAAVETNKPLRQKVSNFIGHIAGPYF